MGAALDPVMDLIVEHLGTYELERSFLPVCRGWFHAAICHPNSCRLPMENWHVGACRQLDEQLSRMREPPEFDELQDLRTALEHAEEELRLTELAASFPAGVTVVLLRHARRLSGLLHWLHMSSSPEAYEPSLALDGSFAPTAPRQGFLRGEADEFRRRVMLLSRIVLELHSRMPNPELPVRWAEWFEEQGAIAGLPQSHSARYRSQREQVAAVWANNRRTFLSTDEHIEALVQCLGELEEMVGGCSSSEDEDDKGSGQAAAVIAHRSAPAACAAGILCAWRRLWGSLHLATSAC